MIGHPHQVPEFWTVIGHPYQEPGKGGMDPSRRVQNGPPAKSRQSLDNATSNSSHYERLHPQQRALGRASSSSIQARRVCTVITNHVGSRRTGHPSKGQCVSGALLRSGLSSLGNG